MNKKRLLIITILIIAVAATTIFIFYEKTPRYPEATGGKFETPSPEEISLGSTIGKLQNLLPYVTKKFTITKYDYKTAKFIVEFTDITNTLEADFYGWLSSSEFYIIPQDRFKLE